MKKTINGKPAVLGLLLLSLLGCASVGDYARPDQGMAADYRGAAEGDSSRTAGNSTSNLPYREFFNDPALLALIDSAMVHNSDLLLAVKNIEYASLSLQQSRLGVLPTLSIQGRVSTSRPSDNGGNPLPEGTGSAEDYTLSAVTSWEADVWGKIRSRKKSALAEYLRTKEAGKAVRTRLVSDVAQGFYNLLMLDEQLDMTKKSRALADTTLSMMKLQYEAGLVTSLAVEQQEAVRLERISSVAGLERLVAAQENALSVLTGAMPDSVERRRGLAAQTFSVVPSPGVPAGLLSNRPDVKAAELALMREHANAGVAAASLYPSFTITAEAGLDALEASDWFSFPGSLFSFVSGGVLQPIFQQGKLRTAYRQAMVERDRQEIVFRRKVLDAVREVSDALVAMEKLETRLQAAQKRQQVLDASVANATLLFKSGMADYLDVVTAQEKSLDAGITLADIRRQRLDAATELYRAVGGGWH